MGWLQTGRDVLVLLAAVNLLALTSGCGAGRMPRNAATDYPLKVVITEVEVDKSTLPPRGSEVGAALMAISDPLTLVVALPIMLAVRAATYDGSLYVSAYPGRYEATYKQKLRLGENQFFVPEEFHRNGGMLFFSANNTAADYIAREYDPAAGDLVRVEIRKVITEPATTEHADAPDTAGAVLH